MDRTTAKGLAQRAVGEIVEDLCGRSQGDWFWDRIDPATKREIRRAWARIIATIFLEDQG